MVRKVISSFLSVMMVFSMISFSTFALPSEVSAATETGAVQNQFGDLLWSVSEDGTLTISGNGAMQNKNSVADYPWGTDELKASVKKVVIEEGVTSIGKYAFNYFKSLTDVTVAASVTSIGDCAFYPIDGVRVQFLGNAPSIGWDIVDENGGKIVVYNDATGFEGDMWYYNIERIDRPATSDPQPEVKPMSIHAEKTTICVGEEFTLSVDNMPEGSHDFEWRNNNKDVYGETYHEKSYYTDDNPDKWTIKPAAAGTMKITLTIYNDDFDDLAQATIEITVVDPEPEVEPMSIHAEKTTICVGEEFTLSVDNMPEGSHDFEWRNNNKDVYGETYHEKSYYTDDNPDKWTIKPAAAGTMKITLTIYNDDFDDLAQATIEITAVEHNYAITKDAKEATCTEAGNTEETTCANCGDVKGGEVIEATGHAYKVTKEAKAATCTETGNTEETTCANCGDVKGGEAIEATGHTTVTDEAVVATCTTTGLTEGSHCSVCDEVITAQEIVPATGHTTEIQGAKEATCKAEGYTGDEVCTVCKETVKTGKAIDKMAHTYKTVVTKKATTKADGEKASKCSVCGDVKTTTVIKKIGKVTLGKTVYVYNGKQNKPVVTVKDSAGTTLKATDYTVAYKNNTKVGKATVTITFKGNYKGTVTKTFKINPVKTSISKLTKGTKAFTVKWTKKTTQVTGYQIRYSTSSKMSNAKTVTVKSNKTISKTVKNLKANKKYYVQVRTYKTVNGEKCYSTWSKTKTVTTK